MAWGATPYLRKKPLPFAALVLAHFEVASALAQAEELGHVRGR